jgi:uncharacterized peroxidase-related enzyme
MNDLFMSWIKEKGFADAGTQMKKIIGESKQVDNIMKVHSLRPHTLTGHLSLYRNVLHHPANTLPKWYLEAIGVYVSAINKCDYCIAHHKEGVSKNYADAEEALQIISALEKCKPELFFNGFFLEGLQYARQLTLSPATIREDEIMTLRRAGFSDGEILEINQVAAYFNYANRTVLGLGVDLKGDVPGFSPGNL